MARDAGQKFNADGTPKVIAVRIEDGVTADTMGVQKYNAGFLAIGQTAKQFVGKEKNKATSGNREVTLETVTTGKTLYLTDLSFTTKAKESEAVLVEITAGGVAIFNAFCHALAPIEAIGIETQPFATTAQIVKLILGPTTAENEICYDILGWEQ